jgi:hypothetical protein
MSFHGTKPGILLYNLQKVILMCKKDFFLHQCAVSWYGELALGILSRKLLGFTEKIF